MARTRSWSRGYGTSALNPDLPPFAIPIGTFTTGWTVQSVIVDLKCVGNFEAIVPYGDQPYAPWGGWVTTLAVQWVPNDTTEPAPTGYYSGPVLLSDSFPWVQQINFQTDSYTPPQPTDDPLLGVYTYVNTTPSEVIRSKAMRTVKPDSPSGTVYLIIDRQNLNGDTTNNFTFDFVYSYAVLALSPP